MKESDLQRVYIYPIYPRDSKIHSNKGFVNIDEGSIMGTDLNCFIIKDNKPYYYDGFGGAPDNFFTKSIT